jgi:hypothetical protein
MYGWWFCDENETLGYGDGRPVQCGKTHTVEGELELCGNGLHASKRLIDALMYASGSILYRVELGGQILHGSDKSCATERTYLARVDCDDILRTFARSCALDVIHLWDAPQVVKDYLATGDDSIRDAAGAAAGAAARAAARAAAWAAARDSQNDRLTVMVANRLRFMELYR